MSRAGRPHPPRDQHGTDVDGRWSVRWALVPPLMLACSVGAGVTLVTMSSNDVAGAAVEPDSYRKGARWDEWKEQRARNGNLRWSVTCGLERHLDGTRITIAVVDKHAVPIEDAAVTLELVPIRDADSRMTVAARSIAPGRYAVDSPLRTPGQWEIRSTITRGDALYRDRSRVWLRCEDPTP